MNPSPATTNRINNRIAVDAMEPSPAPRQRRDRIRADVRVSYYFFCSSPARPAVPILEKRATPRIARSPWIVIAAQVNTAAQSKANDAAAQYKLALAESYVAEVAIEVRDKNAAHNAAEAGIDAAKKAVALKGDSAEYHRLLGTLCGQAISANVLQGMKYGHCAQDEVNKALQLDPKSSVNYLARGVGRTTLPQVFEAAASTWP